MAEENRRLTGKLTLKGIQLILKLGALPFEKIETRRVFLDLTWTGVVFQNGVPVVDYSLVCNVLKTGLRGDYDYIEELAFDVRCILVERWPGSWSVSVRKDFPPTDPPMERATVCIE